MFEVYAEDSTNHTAFDPTSIMGYAIPDSLTVGSFSIGWNTALSPTDMDFMRRQYPSARRARWSSASGGARTAADLAAGGEVDNYHFDVATAASAHHDHRRAPPTPCSRCTAPTTPGAILAWDDDRGQGRNARIVRKLRPGSYWLSVRHKNPASTGPYTIGVKKQR